MRPKRSPWILLLALLPAAAAHGATYVVDSTADATPPPGPA